uniref:Hox cluster protein ShxB n=1 Tax=Callimorpha dominula TaxID=938182 RepID=A0A060D6I6_9NEOP|nr:Hox cluster protein ShxB [Callimorpha dominula]
MLCIINVICVCVSTKNPYFILFQMQNQNLHKNCLKKMKRYRSAFTTEQVNYLEEQFKKFPYIPNSQRKEVAVTLNIPERAVKIWFQNRRMKEKRENVSKEFIEAADPTSIVIAKGQLNNVMIPSANDQQPQSLPLLTDIDNASGSKNVVTNHSTFKSNTSESKIPEITVTETMTEVNKKRSSPAIVTSRNAILTNDFKKSAEFSINLCKKFKMGVFNHSNTTPPLPDIKHKDVKQDIEDKSTANLKITEQTIPEDLSSRKVIAPTANPTQVPNIAVSNPGYISMLPAVSPFYSESYYSASAVFWKPVNVVPSVTTNGASLSVHIPNNIPNMPIVQQNVPKKCCKCDCHVESLLPYNFQQQSPCPQYLITAVPFTNPSATKL